MPGEKVDTLNQTFALLIVKRTKQLVSLAIYIITNEWGRWNHIMNGKFCCLGLGKQKENQDSLNNSKSTITIKFNRKKSIIIFERYFVEIPLLANVPTRELNKNAYFVRFSP